jgi:putative ABC transport system permease protein
MLISILEQGLIFAIIAMGVYITYKILDFPDLSVDGTYPLGAAITASLITAGINPIIAMLASVAAGAAAGLVTGLIHVKLKVRDLLSGIITMTALYSINLHIAGKANLPIFNTTTIFNNSISNSVSPASSSRIKP